ncbi:MAG: ankyrin repeat domain-containing protein [Candidatus Poribacteria bacterium]|nr:ankyrin repeat domain-containing protein [Candidatus Poribacteria bacterium]
MTANSIEHATRDPRDHMLWGWGKGGAYYQRLARILLKAHQSGLRWAAHRLREYLPRFAGAKYEQVRASDLSLKEAQLVIARERGFTSWEALIERAIMLGADPTEHTDDTLSAAFEAVRKGDSDTLRELLKHDPSIVNAMIKAPEISEDYITLLEYAASIEGISTDTRLPIMRALIGAGARMEKVFWANNIEAVQLLIETGALRSDESPAVWQIKSAMLHGNRDAVDFWIERGISPCSFWMAAGAGGIDSVKSYFAEDGALKPEAASDRPNLGEIGWFEETCRSDDPQEILEEALCIASLNGRAEVAALLIERGARVDAIPPGLGAVWTPLHFAVFKGHLAVVMLLAERGANLNNKDGAHHLSPLAWAEHENRVEVARYLRAHSTII